MGKIYFLLPLLKIDQGEVFPVIFTQKKKLVKGKVCFILPSLKK